MEVNYEKLPSHIRFGMFRWIEFGDLPGHWMQMVLQNNLVQSWGFADETNRERMGDIVGFMYNEAPGPVWGSEAKIKEWAEKGGARGWEMPIEHIGIEQEWHGRQGVRPCPIMVTDDDMCGDAVNERGLFCQPHQDKINSGELKITR